MLHVSKTIVELRERGAAGIVRHRCARVQDSCHCGQAKQSCDRDER